LSASREKACFKEVNGGPKNLPGYGAKNKHILRGTLKRNQLWQSSAKQTRGNTEKRNWGGVGDPNPGKTRLPDRYYGIVGKTTNTFSTHKGKKK